MRRGRRTVARASGAESAPGCLTNWLTGVERTAVDGSPALAGGFGSRGTGSTENVSVKTERRTSENPAGMPVAGLPVAAKASTKLGANRCEHCEFAWETKMGISQHLRVKYPLEYQKRLQGG